MRKTIMVVDDEEDIRNTVKTVLEINKFKVVTAVDSDDCLRKVQRIKPDMILLDIMMPGTPVKDIMPLLREFKVAYLTVVKATDIQKEILFSAGNVVDFIQKPFDVDDLVARVQKVVG